MCTAFAVNRLWLNQFYVLQRSSVVADNPTWTACLTTCWPIPLSILRQTVSKSNFISPVDRVSIFVVYANFHIWSVCLLEFPFPSLIVIILLTPVQTRRVCHPCGPGSCPLCNVAAEFDNSSTRKLLYANNLRWLTWKHLWRELKICNMLTSFLFTKLKIVSSSSFGCNSIWSALHDS